MVAVKGLEATRQRGDPLSADYSPGPLPGEAAKTPKFKGNSGPGGGQSRRAQVTVES